MSTVSYTKIGDGKHVKCECGKVVSKSYFYRHRKLPNHDQKLKSFSDPDVLEHSYLNFNTLTADKMTCVCGTVISQWSYQKHSKSKSHVDIMKYKNMNK